MSKVMFWLKKQQQKSKRKLNPSAGLQKKLKNKKHITTRKNLMVIF